MKNIARRTKALVSLSVACLLAAGCADRVEEIAGRGPVKRFERRQHWIYVYARADADNSDLYAADYLGGFAPGYSISDALAVYGTPKKHIPENRGAEYILYENAHGVIRLGAEATADGYTSYPMYFMPNDRRPSVFFCEPIVAQIDMNAEKQVAMIFQTGYLQPHMHAVIEYGQVQEVVFVNKEAIE
jgi:hypothetical protein